MGQASSGTTVATEGFVALIAVEDGSGGSLVLGECVLTPALAIGGAVVVVLTLAGAGWAALLPATHFARDRGRRPRKASAHSLMARRQLLAESKGFSKLKVAVISEEGGRRSCRR